MAAELEPHISLFLKLLLHVLGTTFTTQVNKVTINGVSTHRSSYSNTFDNTFHEIPSMQQLLDELLQYNRWLKDCWIVGEPCWISPPEMLGTQDKSSVVIAFASKEDTDELIKRRGVFISPHKNMPKEANVQTLHSDSLHYADSFACPYQRSYKGDVITAPRTNGGGKKRKPKPMTNDPMNETARTTPAPPTAPAPALTEQLKATLQTAAKVAVPSATDHSP
ncbi:hypothetical protein K439DRAFT_1510862 [Ramaria rubella]|nr:hypothetical protein K439DRAFT_1510862 [Ramaria rubella]